jgi:hypothetical protein
VVIDAIEANGWAAELYDTEWRLLWLSSELLAIVGDEAASQVRVGEHCVAIRREPPLNGKLTMESALGWLRTNLPLFAHDTPGGIPAMRAMLRPEVDAALGPVEEREPRSLWTGEVEFLQGNLRPRRRATSPRRCTRWTASASAG